MNPLRLQSPAAPLAGGGGHPRKPEPFDMEKWRKEWGAFWGRANREAIRAVIPEKG